MALGTPRFGKTYHLQEVVSRAVELGIVQFGLIHDTKRAEPQYQGTVRDNVADLAARPLGEGDSRVIVFHPNPASGTRVSLEEIAALGLRMGRAGAAVVVVGDELYKGLRSARCWDGPSFAEALREGSSIGVSTAGTTQIPQSLPTEAMDLAETTALFMLQGRSLTYAEEQLRLPPEAVSVIRNLQRGEFVLVTNTGDWDGVIYGPN
jgi:hypothetical protein